MQRQDLVYYRERLDAERRAAQRAANAAAARRHRQLAEEYLGLIEANGESAEEPAAS